MFFRNTVIILLVLSLAFVVGCSRKTVYPDNPASATATTDADGIATVDVGPFKINILVQNTSEQPLSGMSATAFLLKDYLMAYAASPTGSYYSNVTIKTYEDAQKRHKPEAGAEIEATTQAASARKIDITVTLTSAGVASYAYDTPVDNMDAIKDDAWITLATQDYDMSGLYDLADSVDLSGSTMMHLTPEVSSNIGAGRRTGTFIVNSINDVPTFASLMGYTLRVFDGDTIHTSILNFQDAPLPVLVIDDIGMNRNFFVQFTLTWGQNPGDLDSHIWTPSVEGSTYHVYYASRGNMSTPPYVDLDVDDVTSYGPEHITIYTEYPGTYTYAIYHYSGSGDISTSEAAVDILWPDGTVQNFPVPAGSASANWWWHVCTIDGTTGQITPINQLSANPPSPFTLPNQPVKPMAD